MATTRDKIYVHWLGNAFSPGMEDEEILRRVQKFHQRDRGYADIGYSFAVGRSARAFECRGLNIRGAHTSGENSDSYGIVFLIGEGEVPTEEMWTTFTHLVEYIRVNDLIFRGSVDGRIFGHRHDDQASTECPGDVLASLALEYRHSRDYVAKAPTVEQGFLSLVQAMLASAGFDVEDHADQEEATLESLRELIAQWRVINQAMAEIERSVRGLGDLYQDET